MEFESMGSVEPTAEQISVLAELSGEDEPVVMINLLRYREQAVYPDGFDAEPCSGREAYGRYGEVALGRIASVGGSIRWMGDVVATVIAPGEECWDDAVLVQYPSPQAFLDMVAQPEYQVAVPHRSAGLADSRLIVARTVANFLQGD
jgi:uncharacterized protein (DUF1330 family)